MNRTRAVSKAALVLLIVSLVGAAEKREGRAAGRLPVKIWSDRGDVSRLDLLHGAGGTGHAPNPKATYKFIRDETKGASPKFDAVDEKGVQWRVKVGEEAQSETAATRLVWAGGYFVDELYYLPQIKVRGVPKEFLSPEGMVVGARLERRSKGAKKLGDWAWFDGPFEGAKELNGLRVMMALINNWDVKSSNNSIVSIGGQQRFLVSDLGATFGRTGGIGDRTKSNLADYEDSKFIDKVEPEHVDFVLNSRPLFLLAVVDPYHYRQLSKRETIAKDIPIADAKWLGQRLGKLSAQQLLDCFRAGGYPPLIAQRYAAVVRKRIAEINAL